jgi:NAD(P)-dependent dehydrogenase (short-subunit alcohol dehydrogenase family)
VGTHVRAGRALTRCVPPARPSAQAPILSGLGPTTTNSTEAIAGRDLTGVLAVVTGGYSGIGLETTRTLAAAGAQVIVPARTRTTAHRALTGVPGVEVADVDLLDPRSVEAFARHVLAARRPLHLLIDGAGIMATPLLRDARGYEAQFSANHLGHFHLAVRLWPALRAARGAGWSRCRRGRTGSPASTSPTRSSGAGRTTAGRCTDS